MPSEYVRLLYLKISVTLCANIMFIFYYKLVQTLKNVSILFIFF